MACTDFEFMIEEEIQAYLYNNRIKYDSAIQKPRHPICACLLFLIKVILVCLIIGGLGVAVVYYTPIWEMVENWMYPPQEEEAWFDFITNQINTTNNKYADMFNKWTPDITSSHNFMHRP